MVGRTIGIAVERSRVAAVAVRGGRVVWAADASYSEPAELTSVLAGLAAERPRGFRTARVALAPDVARVKEVDGLPRLGAGELAAHVRLQSRRYFVQNGTALVTDAAPVGGRRPKIPKVVLAAAPEPVVEAVAAGLDAAALVLRDMAPAVLYGAQEAHPDGPLHALGARAESFRAAYGAAVARHPPLVLLPAAARWNRDRRATRSLVRWAVLCAGALVLAGLAYVGSLLRQSRAVETQLLSLRPALGAALSVRRDLDATTSALEVLQDADVRRGHLTRLLADLTRTLPDSAFLGLLRVEREGQGTMMGYAPRAAAVLAALERVPDLADPQLDGAVTREVVGGREWERFGVRFRVVGFEQERR